MEEHRGFSASFLVMAVLLSACAGVPVPHQQGTTIAVWDLENLSPEDAARPDLGELLAAKVIEVMKEKGRYQVVERDRILLALEELNLGTTSLVDESTRLRLGQMVGANMMVFGGYMVIADQMRLDLRLVEVETGKILKTAQRVRAATDIAQWLSAAEEAADDLI
jgi:curli biogenesis system outer membrane secretion channel CsgG